MRVFDGAELVGDMPVRALVDDCPLYDLQPRKPTQPIYAPPAATAGLTLASAPRDILLAILSSPNLSSRRPLFERYDSIVQSRTVRRPEQADAAVLALPDASALAAVQRRQYGDDPKEACGLVGCNGRQIAGYASLLKH